MYQRGEKHSLPEPESTESIHIRIRSPIWLLALLVSMPAMILHYVRACRSRVTVQFYACACMSVRALCETIDDNQLR